MNEYGILTKNLETFTGSIYRILLHRYLSMLDLKLKPSRFINTTVNQNTSTEAIYLRSEKIQVKDLAERHLGFFPQTGKLFPLMEDQLKKTME